MKNIDEKIFNALINKDINLATEALTMPNTDSVTNSVRKKLNSLTPKQILEIQDFLYLLLNSCYQNKLFYSNTSLASLTLEADKLFLLKENIIYYLGRLSVPPDVQILKSAYDLDSDLHIKLNITFSSLITFDETIEKDFISKFKPGNNYDLLLRSWTMAFFANSNNPYVYKDIKNDDWSLAKKPRINRLSINSSENPKYLKAMSFRALDLLVLYLFLENRKTDVLTKAESAIVSNSFIEYPKFSKTKIQFLKSLKEKLGAKYSS